MALDKRALSRIITSQYVSGSVRSFFFAASNELLSAIVAAGFLNDCRATLEAGDIVMVSVDNDGTPDFVTLKVVSVPVSGNVTTARLPLNEVAGDQTNIAALTENAGAIGGTNDGDLPALTGSPGGTDAAYVTALIAATRENATKINAILATLVTAGLIAAP